MEKEGVVGKVGFLIVGLIVLVLAVLVVRNYYGEGIVLFGSDGGYGDGSGCYPKQCGSLTKEECGMCDNGKSGIIFFQADGYCENGKCTYSWYKLGETPCNSENPCCYMDGDKPKCTCCEGDEKSQCYGNFLESGIISYTCNDGKWESNSKKCSLGQRCKDKPMPPRCEGSSFPAPPIKSVVGCTIGFCLGGPIGLTCSLVCTGVGGVACTYIPATDTYVSNSGIAYQITPSNLNFNQQAIIELDYDFPADIEEPTSAGLYSFDDNEVAQECEKEELSSVTQNIGSAGGVVSLGDEFKLIIPQGSLSNYEEITITKINMTCPSS